MLTSRTVALAARGTQGTRAALFVLVLLGASAPGRLLAQAATDDERARSHFLAGTSFFEQRRYAEAAEQFKEAYRLSDRAELLVNISTCHERLGQFDRAVEALEAFLAAAPDDPRRRTFEARLASLQASAEQAAERAGALGPDSEQDEEATERPEGDGEPAASVPWLRVTGYSAAGVGVALGVVAIATGIAANGRYSDVEGACDTDGICPSELRGDVRSGQRLARTAVGTAVVGASALSVGALLVFLDIKRGRPSADGEALELAPGPGEFGFSLRRRF